MTEPPRPSARDLVRKRSQSYARPDTGRHHHIGAAPEQQPAHDADGSASMARTSAVQLAGRTSTQLRKQRARAEEQMARAAAELDFEAAAALRDDLVRLDAELTSREAQDG